MNKTEKDLRKLLEYIDRSDKNEFCITYSKDLLPKSLLFKIKKGAGEEYNLYDIYFYLDRKKIIVEYLYEDPQHGHAMIGKRLELLISSVTANKIMKHLHDESYNDGVIKLSKRAAEIAAEELSFSRRANK